MIPHFLLRFPKRYYVIVMLFAGNLLHSLPNTSIMTVDMTSNKTFEHPNGTIGIKEAEYRWTASEIGVVLGMDAIGHFFSGFTGVVISRFGGVTSLGMGMALEVIVSLTAPLAVNTHLYLFMANRFAYGFIAGFRTICIMDVFTHWAPPDERVQLVNYGQLGSAAGSAITLPVSGFVVQNFGWKCLFYSFGIVTLIWNLVWISWVSNDPSTDRFISEKERTYMSQQMNYVPKNKSLIPYRKIFTSLPVYALMNEFFVAMFTRTFMNLLLPLYVKDMYHANVQTVGLISGIPELTAFFIKPLFAYLADYLRSKPNKFSIGKIHNIFLFWGQSLTVVFFFIAAMWNNMIGCIVCLTLARISFGISQISYNVILIDTCGQYAAFMQSIAVFFKSSAHFINPLVVGFLVPNHSQSEWNIYFIFISSLTMYGVIAFICFGSGDLQPWAKVPDKCVVHEIEYERVRKSDGSTSAEVYECR